MIKFPKLKRWDAISIKWIDSTSLGENWEPYDWESMAKESMIIRSVGIFLLSGDDYVAISRSVCLPIPRIHENSVLDGTLKIPKIAITELKLLI